MATPTGAPEAKDAKPIRKLIVAVIAAVVAYVANQLGLEFDDEDITTAVDLFVTLLAAYLTPDPRVIGSTGRETA